MIRPLLAALLLLAAPAWAGPLAFTQTHSADGVPLNVVTAGDPAKPAMVLIHGFSQSYLSFLPQLTDSALQARFRMVAVDMRGHGASGKPWDGPSYTESKRWADDIQAAITASGVRRPVLVGWSFGGYCILDYIRTYGTGQIAGIVFVSSNGGLLPRPPGTPKQPEDDLEAFMRDADTFMGLMSAHSTAADARARGYASYLMLPLYARRAMVGRNLDNHDLADRLDLPVRFIFGAADPLAAPGQVDKLRAVAPRATISIYPDTGHSPFVEATPRFNAELAAFVDAAARR